MTVFADLQPRGDLAVGARLKQVIDGLTSLERYGTLAEIGAVVEFLVTPAARFMTGSIVTVGGGYNA